MVDIDDVKFVWEGDRLLFTLCRSSAPVTLLEGDTFWVSGDLMEEIRDTAPDIERPSNIWAGIEGRYGMWAVELYIVHAGGDTQMFVGNMVQ